MVYADITISVSVLCIEKIYDVQFETRAHAWRARPGADLSQRESVGET